MFADGSRTNSGTTSTMRNAECLVQVQVRDIRPELPRLRQSYKGVEIRAIDVHLTAGFVHHRTDFGNGRFKHPMGRGVGDHQRTNISLMLDDLHPEVFDINVSALIA